MGIELRVGRREARTPEDPGETNTPTAELMGVLPLLTGRLKALDLGCAHTHDALFLAECGIDVTAVASSLQECSEIQRAATEKSIVLQTEMADPASYQFRRKYDLIVARRRLARYTVEDAEQMVRAIQAYTRRGGLNVVEFTTPMASPSAEAAHAQMHPRTWLAALYEGWRVLGDQFYLADFSIAAPVPSSGSILVQKIFTQRP